MSNWMNDVNRQLADEWGIKMMHVFQTFSLVADAQNPNPPVQYVPIPKDNRLPATRPRFANEH